MRARAPEVERFSAALDGAATRPAPGANPAAARRARQDAAAGGKDLPRPAPAGAASGQAPKPSERRPEGRDPAATTPTAPASRRAAASSTRAGATVAARSASDTPDAADSPVAPDSAPRGPARAAPASTAAGHDGDPADNDGQNADVAALESLLPDIPLIFVAQPAPVPASEIAIGEGALPAGTVGAGALTVPATAAIAGAGSNVERVTVPATDAPLALPVAAPAPSPGGISPADAAAVTRLVAASPAAGQAASVAPDKPLSLTLAPGPVAVGTTTVQAGTAPALVPVTAPAALAAQAVFSAAAIGVAQPAGRAFASAIAAASASQRRAAPLGDDSTALTPLPLTASVAAAAPLAEEAAAPLYLRRHDLAQGLADRIEALRDAADATSTRIRLVPDALGKIDIAVRRDGATLHVHFAAEAAATRAALAEAQPRLADIAAERGLALGETTVGAGSGEQGGQRPPAAQPAAPQATPPRPQSSAQSVSDQRLA